MLYATKQLQIENSIVILSTTSVRLTPKTRMQSTSKKLCCERQRKYKLSIFNFNIG